MKRQQILYVQSSIFGENGVSTGIAKKLLGTLAAATDSTIVERNVSAGDIPHYNLQTIEAINANSASLADALIAEVQQADVLVISAPMYNFSIPSQLKSWFDHIARAGLTFEYTPSGVKGLLTNKKVYVVTARGGLHQENGTDLDNQYITTMLNFLGLHDIEVISAEGVNLGAQSRAKSIAAAEQRALSVA